MPLNAEQHKSGKRNRFLEICGVFATMGDETLLSSSTLSLSGDKGAPGCNPPLLSARIILSFCFSISLAVYECLV